jgi:4-guanidinobutyraldehyde dehydrogenase / NAD-dependent aldehyde dehydrogenase
MSNDWIIRSQEINLEVRNFIEGRSTTVGGEPMEKVSPRDGQAICQFGAGDLRDVEECVSSARRAFDDGRWSKLPPQSRKEILLKLAALIEHNKEDLALLESLDVGKPIRNALAIDVPAAAALLRWNAEAADKYNGQVYFVDQGNLSYQLHRPVGVVAGIVGWNFPLLLAVGKIAPALATGNCIILKPSEVTSFSARRVAELGMQAGIPAGVLNIVHGDGRIGAALASHRQVDLVTFTGSTRTGNHLLAASGASNMKRLILECGGKGANIVFNDAPRLDAVADAIVERAFWNQGEVCTASSRLLVQDGIRKELLDLVMKKVEKLNPGDPLDPSTTFGALVSESHRRKVLHYIEQGEREGARKIFQNTNPGPFENGFYLAPVIFTDVLRHHTIAREEIFGPVLSVLTFQSEEEAIQLANDTIYGLSAILWTKDVGRGHRAVQSIRAGWIVVNTTEKPEGGPGDGVVSMGGHKQSGIGMEGGREGLEAYVSKTAVQVFM